MVYTRCSKNEYDAFANVAGDEHWGWDNILPYAYKVRFFSLEFIRPAQVLVEREARSSQRRS